MLMKALDFIQIFASNVRRLDFRLSSAQVIMAVIAGYRRHSTITEATRLHPNTVTNILQDLIAQGYVNRIGDGRPYVYRPTADGEQLAGNLLDKIHSPAHENPLLSTEENAAGWPAFSGTRTENTLRRTNSKRWWKTPNWQPCSRKRRNSNASGKWALHHRTPSWICSSPSPRQNSISIITPLPDNLTR